MEPAPDTYYNGRNHKVWCCYTIKRAIEGYLCACLSGRIAAIDQVGTLYYVEIATK